MGDNYDRLIDLYPSHNTDQAAPELLPCPFCGSVDLSFADMGVDGGFTICLDCESQGPFGNEDAWNRRADLAAPSAPAEVEGLVICDGCGCTTADAELSAMRGERSSLISCCPERKMRPATRDDWDKQRAALRALAGDHP